MEAQNHETFALPGELPYLEHFARVSPAAPGGAAAALYIREEAASPTAAELVGALLRRLPVRLFGFKPGESAAALVEELCGHWRRGGWAVLDLRGDPAGLLLKAMIAFDRQQAVELGSGKKIGPMPARARLIVVADRELIEERVSYPRFYQLFGMLRAI